MELAEAQKIDAIRYLPKGGNLTGGDQNGRVKTYTVEVSMTGADDSWTKVEITPSTQEWANGTDWKSLSLYSRLRRSLSALQVLKLMVTEVRRTSL